MVVFNKTGKFLLRHLVIKFHMLSCIPVYNKFPVYTKLSVYSGLEGSTIPLFLGTGIMHWLWELNKMFMGSNKIGRTSKPIMQLYIESFQGSTSFAKDGCTAKYKELINKVCLLHAYPTTLESWRNLNLDVPQSYRELFFTVPKIGSASI